MTKPNKPYDTTPCLDPMIYLASQCKMSYKYLQFSTYKCKNHDKVVVGGGARLSFFYHNRQTHRHTHRQTHRPRYRGGSTT